MFNGLGLHLGNLSRLSNAQTRSISAENFTGGKGQGGRATEGFSTNASRELGPGWKVSPAIGVAPGECRELAKGHQGRADQGGENPNMYRSDVHVDPNCSAPRKNSQPELPAQAGCRRRKFRVTMGLRGTKV